MPGPTRRPTVLVLDDDEDSVLILEAALDASGFDVRVARSWREAREMLESTPTDALVTDLSLGDGDALELMASLGARRPRVAVLVTGFGGAEDRARSAEAGFDAHLVKPIALDQLEHTLWRCLTSSEQAAARG
ncbi:MAG: response regulator [Labilithrix sp.]|nr:response regulator [Labilithrix sp.]